MEVVTSLPADTPLSRVAAAVRRIEELGFDTVHISETVHDPFAACALAVEHSSTLTIRTSMVVAFARSPMVTACAAWDLACWSGGRFQLGIASQVRGNVVGRYSMPWTDPVAQLGDYIAALRAIFAAFQHGTPLDHHGSHYHFTRLQPYFDPGPLDTPAPAIWMGAVNRRMTELAGAVADGFVAHPTGSHPRTLLEQTLPTLRAGARGRDRADEPRVVVVPKVVTGRDREALARAREAVRSELAFLYSTPAYRGTLDRLGLGSVADELTAAARAKDWTRLPTILTDESVAELVPQATYAELPELLAERYRGHCHGIALGVPSDPRDDDEFRRLLTRIRAIR
ncbi:MULTISPECIES: TIGR03617 family F420-dependent LLM class oxidoreductase [unclassified Nocardia]|uniref:TIGR03617 family F420-dependent LLM class oxidoreductase n=1 Tax=unclassified Nocardia TaxID=2637762 RepID=UPI0024A9B1EF|nr:MULTISPECIES: TIGR03617 family F420-dependent LLM class oxidoreductase [unclassified Nocardia]